MKKQFIAWAALAGIFASAWSVAGQNYSIDWSTIAGGGGTSSGGNYSLSGTIGQPATTQMSGGNYSLQSGFWSVVQVIQVDGAPLVRIVRAGANATLSWPAAATGFVLEQNGNLIQTTGWSGVSQSVTTTNGTNYVTVPVSPGYNFFRLKKP
jgi:hypothetical protein